MPLRTSLVAQPHLYMGDSTGKPLDYGMVYFGQPYKDPEYYPIDIYYDESLTMAAAQPVRTKGGFLNANGQMTEVYAAETTYSVKVLDSYGRQVFYQPFMTKESSDGSVSTRIPYPNAVSRPLSSKNADTVSIKDFGAIGDGVTDDTAAVQAAINSGVSLHWGNNNDTYLVTNTITHSASKSVFWRSNGASIKFLPATQKAAIFDIELDGNNFTLDSKLKFDGNKKSVSGVKLRNTSDTPSNVLANNIEVTRCHRADQSINGGDGVYVVGLMDSVVLNSPRVTHISMAAGAGISLSQGVSGITVSRNVANKYQKPKAIRINNPYIEEIYSEDLGYELDQDGIRAFTDYAQATVAPNETDVVINGGVFKNCLGRSIKSQVENCKVVGSHFIRTRGFTRGYGNHEIDFQVGGGSVSDVTFLYDGSRPNNLVAADTASAGKSVGLASIKGVKGSVTNLVNTNRFYTLFRLTAPLSKKTSINISDVTVLGDESEKLDYLFSLQGSTNETPTINISDISVRLTQALSRDTTNNTGYYNLVNVTNQESSDVVVVNADRPSRAKVSTLNTAGFKTATKLTTTTQSPDVTKVNSIVAKNHGYSAGMITPVNAEVGAGASVSLGSFGYTTSAFIAIISIAHTANSQCVVAAGGGLLNLVTVASAVTASASEPATGDYRLYFSGDNLMLKNTTTTGRIVTGLVVG